MKFKEVWKKLNEPLKKHFLSPGEKLVIHNMPYKIQHVQRIADDKIVVTYNLNIPSNGPQEIEPI